EAGRIAWEAGARVIVLPTIPFGVQTNQLDIPLCINVNPSTQGAVLADVVASLEPHGIRKVVILNGHGGNDFKTIVREMQPDVEPFLCVVNWYAAADPSQYFDEPGDHAGEMETSMVMHLAPDLVLPLEQAGSGVEHRFRIAALRQGWAWAPRMWSSASEDTGIGNPQAATAAKGAVFFAAVTERIAGFLCDLAAADPDDLYDCAQVTEDRDREAPQAPRRRDDHGTRDRTGTPEPWPRCLPARAPAVRPASARAQARLRRCPCARREGRAAARVGLVMPVAATALAERLPPLRRRRERHRLRRPAGTPARDPDRGPTRPDRRNARRAAPAMVRAGPVGGRVPRDRERAAGRRSRRARAGDDPERHRPGADAQHRAGRARPARRRTGGGLHRAPAPGEGNRGARCGVAAHRAGSAECTPGHRRRRAARARAALSPRRRPARTLAGVPPRCAGDHEGARPARPPDSPRGLPELDRRGDGRRPPGRIDDGRRSDRSRRGRRD